MTSAEAENMPRVHVLVTNWNGREHLEACFDALLASGYSNVEFVLLDNGSSDGSADFVRGRYGDDPRLTFLECGANLGWSGANNLGLRRAQESGADYVFLLNNDTSIAPDALEQCVAQAEANPALGIVAPKMLLFDQPLILNSIGLECSRVGSAWDRGLGRLDAPRWNDVCNVIGACGGACLIRVAALEKTGLFPEEFGIYFDDLDLGLRMWDAGYEVATCPQATVRHKVSASFGADRAREKYYLTTRNRFWMLLRNFPWAWLWLHAPLLAFGELRALGRATLDGAWWKYSAHARAWGAALGYLSRARQARAYRKTAGLACGRFLPLLNRSRMFAPAVPLPEDGWYPEQPRDGAWVRPMSSCAWLDHPGGRLRVIAQNCYPEQGAVEIHVRVEGRLVAVFEARERAEADLDLPRGHLKFEAKRIFWAEDTGTPADYGGWLRFEPR